MRAVSPHSYRDLSKAHALSHSYIVRVSGKLTGRERHECRGIVDEFPFWNWGCHQPFRYEPAIWPEGVREGGEVSGVTLDGEEVDTRRGSFWDITDPGQMMQNRSQRDRLDGEREEGGQRTMVLSSFHGKCQGSMRPSETHSVQQA